MCPLKLKTLNNRHYTCSTHFITFTPIFINKNPQNVEFFTENFTSITKLITSRFRIDWLLLEKFEQILFGEVGLDSRDELSRAIYGILLSLGINSREEGLFYALSARGSEAWPSKDNLRSGLREEVANSSLPARAKIKKLQQKLAFLLDIWSLSVFLKNWSGYLGEIFFTGQLDFRGRFYYAGKITPTNSLALRNALRSGFCGHKFYTRTEIEL